MLLDSPLTIIRKIYCRHSKPFRNIRSSLSKVTFPLSLTRSGKTPSWQASQMSSYFTLIFDKSTDLSHAIVLPRPSSGSTRGEKPSSLCIFLLL